MSGLLDLIRKARPAELAEAVAEARERLATLPPAPTRPVMDRAARKGLGEQLAADYDRVITKGGAAHLALRAKLESAIDEARAKVEDLDVARAEAVAGYAAQRDGITARLWSERPELVDALLAELEAEAGDLRAQSRNIITSPDARLDVRHPRPPAGKLLQEPSRDPEDYPVRTLTNWPFVDARRRAIFALVEQVKEWTAKGTFSTDDELRRLVDAERARLPRVPSLEELSR